MFSLFAPPQYSDELPEQGMLHPDDWVVEPLAM
jgi:hypothetical protein